MTDKTKVKHSYPNDLNYEHFGRDKNNAVKIWNQANVTMVIHIRGDLKDYVIDGLTKDMTFEDVFNKFLNSCVTKYGKKIKSMKFKQLKFIAEGWYPIKEEDYTKTLGEFSEIE